MPATIVQAESSGNGDDALIGLTSTVDWATARGDASSTGSNYNNSSSTNSVCVYARKVTGRGSPNWLCYRSYYSFDVADLEGTVDSATVKIHLDNLGNTGPASGALLVESTLLAGDASDFGNCFTSGTTFGSRLTDTGFSISTTGAVHDFDLNATGLSRLNGKIGEAGDDGKFQVCLMAERYDYLGYDPGGTTYARFSGVYSEAAVNKPSIAIEFAEAVTHNAAFFGSNF